MNIILGNSSYPNHMTDEGEQLQRSLEAAGWLLCGHGYGDGEKNVARILDRHNPKIVFVQDARDWHKSQGGAFGRKDLHYDNYEALRRHPSFKVMPVKDAGSCIDFQRDFAKEIGLNAAVIYYHQQSVLNYSGWLKGMPFIRHWHTVDANYIRSIDMTKSRIRGIATGALNRNVYPLRCQIFDHAQNLGITAHRHPGYGNNGCATPGYLKMLCGYKIHVKTASAYGFSLRGIIESVACGCTPVTNLPAYDVLPEIDGALVRVGKDASINEVRGAINKAEEEWDMSERLEWSKKALEFYDYKVAGARLSEAIIGMAGQ